MDDFLANIPDVSAGGLVAFIVVLVLVGKLVPISHLRQEQERSARLEDIIEKQRAANDEQARNVGKMADSLDEVLHIVRSLPRKEELPP